MKDCAMGFGEIPVAGDTLQLAPGLATGMAISKEVGASEPTVIGTILIRTEMARRVDSALASSGAGEQAEPAIFEAE